MRSPCLVLALCLLACETPEEASARNPYPVGMTHTTSAQAPHYEVGLSTNLRISAQLMRVCSVEFSETDQGARYWFDPGALVLEDHDVLLQLARCLTKGALAGRTLRLVALPEAPTQEATARANVPSLIELHASHARQYLIDHGVPAARISVDATEHAGDAGAPIRDGRVDVHLAPR